MAEGIVSFRNGIFHAAEGIVSFCNGMFHPAEGIVSFRNGMFHPAEGTVSFRNGIFHAAEGIVSFRNGIFHPAEGIADFSSARFRTVGGAADFSSGMPHAEEDARTYGPATPPPIRNIRLSQCRISRLPRPPGMFPDPKQSRRPGSDKPVDNQSLPAQNLHQEIPPIRITRYRGRVNRHCCARMKILKYAAVVVALSVCVSCSEKAPAYPDAGLVIEDGGATCGFYAKHDVNGDFTVTLTTSRMEYSEKGHELVLDWTSEHGRTKDEYEFTINIDGVTSRKSATYEGVPITLLDTPLKVSLESVNP